MSFLIASPEALAATATYLTGIGSAINAANAVAAAPTTEILAAGTDEVSTAISALFGAHAQAYQALSAHVAAFHDQFVHTLTAGAGSYMAAEAAASPLQALQLELLNAINAPTLALLGRPLIGDGTDAVADQRPANNAWVGALTALSTSCANVALAVSAAAYHPPPEVRAATNCARYAAACALICWYSCAFAPNSAAIAIDTSSAAVGRQRRRRACHERIGRADRRTDPRHICGGRGQKEGCAITNDM